MTYASNWLAHDPDLSFSNLASLAVFLQLAQISSIPDSIFYSGYCYNNDKIITYSNDFKTLIFKDDATPPSNKTWIDKIKN